MRKSIFIIFGWLISLLASIIWAYENPDKITEFKDKLKIYTPEHEFIEEKNNLNNNKEVFKSNHFVLNVTKIASISSKTTFLLNNSIDKKFDINDVSIFTQEGFDLKKNDAVKLKINKNFTNDFNGGLKTIFFVNKEIFGLTSSSDRNCYYASIINLSNSDELFKTKCLPDTDIDFNGLGSTTIHKDNEILISIGTPTSSSDAISNLAQNKDSFFGKILSIKKDDFITKELNPKIFSIGHRNPQGITKIQGEIFSVEHGPQGGDELNKIKHNYNYGWPEVSYGTKYSYDNGGRSYILDHEKNGYEEPIFAFVPSIGISALNKCPSKLSDYYKKNCLIGLSLYGNNLRPGKSLLIFLLDENLGKIQSIEKISLDKPLRHFMTNSKNEIFEDIDGNIYVSSDSKGIYRINFNSFRE